MNATCLAIHVSPPIEIPARAVTLILSGSKNTYTSIRKAKELAELNVQEDIRVTTRTRMNASNVMLHVLLVR